MIGQQLKQLPAHIISNMVASALAEDIGSGDITAKIISEQQTNTATIITRNFTCVCGVAWVNEVFSQLCASHNDIEHSVKIDWHVKDGDKVEANTILCTLSGNSRYLLTGERTALNFLQTLSATATCTWRSCQDISNNITKLLDTRKTIPNMRLAQKYAVACGGGYNHRLGLYDAFLIKENHILAAGSIENAIKQARNIDKSLEVEIEVENLNELKQAIHAGADIIMLDNFSFYDIKQAVEYNRQQVKPSKLEVSGNITKEQLQQLSILEIDFISSGALTKNIQAIDLSMRIIK